MASGTKLERVAPVLRARSGRAWRGWLAAIGLGAVLIAGVGLERGVDRADAQSPAGAGPGLVDPAAAADHLGKTTAAGGKGYRFTVVSRSTLFAKAGGPRIDVPDPKNPKEVIGTADSYYLGSDIEQGIVTPAGMWLEMRAGPATPDGEPDFANAPVTLSALQHGAKTWRNDGDGWYASDATPGIGLDLVSAPLLPRMLRNAKALGAPVAAKVNGVDASSAKATVALADLPGIMAVDAAPFTELRDKADLVFDPAGRLISIHAVSRNTKVDVFDLLVDTTITFDYNTPTGQLPNPEPLLGAPRASAAPADAPAPDASAAASDQ